MVIFGRSNVVSDAPISHCDIVLCRNVLIYFNTETQKQIFRRLHYALEPGGVLFLGKSESKLNESKYFRSVNQRWRIFQRSADFKDVPQQQDSARIQLTMSDDKKLEREFADA